MTTNHNEPAVPNIGLTLIPSGSTKSANFLRAVNYTDIRRRLPNSLSINEGSKQLLKLAVQDDGTLTAQYEPEDLDEAARIFVDCTIKYYNAETSINLRRPPEEPQQQ